MIQFRAAPLEDGRVGRSALNQVNEQVPLVFPEYGEIAGLATSGD
jgi:hypothetical protein